MNNLEEANKATNSKDANDLMNEDSSIMEECSYHSF